MTMARSMLSLRSCVLALLLLPQVALCQYDEIAAAFGSTVEEILSLGGRPDAVCTFAFNATADNCGQLIEAYESSSKGRTTTRRRRHKQRQRELLTLDIIDDPAAADDDDDEEREECDCYNFCNGELVGCFDEGETPPFFTCELRNVVAGCQKETPTIFSPAEDIQKPCPEGYMCSKEKQRSCEEIREIPIQLGLGDVHAGIWCPGWENRSENGLHICPAGSYCPNSTTVIPCPKGFFCPHKTEFPELKCSHCSEGAETLERDPMGYIVAAIALGLFGIFFLYYLFKRYNADAYDKLLELAGRKYDPIKERIQYNKRQEKLKLLLPKLQVIESRLKQNSQRLQQQGQGPNNKSADATRIIDTNAQSGGIKFDARKMFDLIDVNHDGRLSYEEISNALDLDDLQWREFTRRMNRAAKLPPETDTIPREVFVNYFLRVLEQTTHFEPTQNEADQLFTEILELSGTEDLDVIPHESLFESSLADFLSETQIFHIIKRFRELQKKHQDHKLSSDLEEGGDNDASFSALIPAGARKRLSVFQWGGSAAASPKPIREDPDLTDNNGSPARNDDAEPRGSAPDIAMGADNSIQQRGSNSRRRRSSFAQSLVAGRRASAASPTNATSYDQPHRNPFKYKRQSIFIGLPKKDTISREEFIAWYPGLLTEVLSEEDEERNKRESCLSDLPRGVDIAFENLSLTVTVKGNKVKIVDRVTGRLQAGTMTALMGGSGAGKTSLLNALCGRAFYGEVTGIVKINGHKTSIEDHSHTVGFVPQDDIVYAELTVRENLIFSGKFQSPKGTSMEAIEELADETMASLGLSRVMHSIVGDVTRRGVSGGEKKRVNIGLELMSRPRILFLDEPTSGLDANSALLVMESLKTLVNKQGTTICSVIHQPRKFIFELFDTLILLGVGGKMVFHGPVGDAEDYFKSHNYVLPKGESISDWLIDISSGRLGPTVSDESEHTSGQKSGGLEETQEEDSDEMSSLLPPTESTSIPKETAAGMSETSMPRKETSDEYDIDEMIAVSAKESQSNIASMKSLLQSTPFNTGVGEGLQDEASKAKTRREVLYRHWNEHFDALPDEKKKQYEAPTPYDLPAKVERTAVVKQLGYQIQRCAIVGRRNWTTKVIDAALIIFAVVLVSAMDGTVEPTRDMDLFEVPYERIAEPTRLEDLLSEFPTLFMYALSGNTKNMVYATKLSALLAILVALPAGRILLSKRKEFFREAASGYNANAYMAAVNIMLTFEVTIQCVLAGVVAIWFRNTLAVWYSHLLQFILLGWLASSWSLIFPLIVPVENATTATGFYVVIASLLFSGNTSPILYKDMYASKVTNALCSLFSPARFFIEAMAVAESRCLPVQSGFTNLGQNLRGEALQVASWNLLGLGQNDLGTIAQQSTKGWYWSVLPAFLAGVWLRWVSLGLIHISERPKQAKKPFYEILDARLIFNICLYVIIFGCLLGGAIWSTLRVSSTIEPDALFEEKN